MAAEKSPEKKVMDVAHPSQVTANPTSRPVLVSNRPIMQDPMMASTDDAPETDKPAAAKPSDAPLEPHAEKVIKPPESAKEAEPEVEDLPLVADIIPAEDTEKSKEEPELDTEPADEKAAESPAEKEAVPSETPVETTSNDIDVEGGDDKQVDPEAVKMSEEDKKRAAEVEEIISSGRYNVPINSNAQRRTRIITIQLILLAVILGVVLLDALLDVGILNLPIPHTHFFSL